MSEPLADWQERVIQEKAELDEKLDKLNRFIFNPAYLALSESERINLGEQHYTMRNYSGILERRIAGFKPLN